MQKDNNNKKKRRSEKGVAVKIQIMYINSPGYSCFSMYEYIYIEFKDLFYKGDLGLNEKNNMKTHRKHRFE